MRTLHVFRLRPHGAFHFGTQGVGVETSGERCTSDTLHAALFVEALHGGNRFRNLVDAAQQPPFRVSSCFPYAGKALLFPLPRLKLIPDAEFQPGTRKQWKKLHYISQTVLTAVLAAPEAMKFAPTLDNQPGKFYQGGKVLIAREDDPGFGDTKLWSIDRLDHVTVDRERESSQYYAVGQVRFAENCGLFVLVETEQPAVLEQVKELLIRLGHSGLGGRRSGGLGQFEVKGSQSIDLPDPADHKRTLLLSRYLPTKAELADGVLGEHAAYDLVQLGGWLGSDEAPARYRKGIRLLTEGSVVCNTQGRTPRGQVVDVRPDEAPGSPPFPHPVWRSGLALGVGVAAEES